MPGQTLFSIGEALIDMIPTRSGCEFAEVPSFMPRIGGAPANVCGAFARLGGQAALLTRSTRTGSGMPSLCIFAAWGWWKAPYAGRTARPSGRRRTRVPS